MSKAKAFSTGHLLSPYYNVEAMLNAYKHIQGQLPGHVVNIITQSSHSERPAFEGSMLCDHHFVRLSIFCK